MEQDDFYMNHEFMMPDGTTESFDGIEPFLPNYTDSSTDDALPYYDQIMNVSGGETLNELLAEVDGLTLPDSMVEESVSKASSFFGIPEPQITEANPIGGAAAVAPNSSDSLFDDIVVYDRTQLMAMGIEGQDSLDLVMTHEAAHRVFQNSTFEGMNNGAWEQELACDFFAGVRAGMENMYIGNFEEALKGPGSDTHPSGNLRADFIELGHIVSSEMINRGVEPNFENCLERLKQHLAFRASDIYAARSIVDNLTTM